MEGQGRDRREGAHRQARGQLTCGAGEWTSGQMRPRVKARSRKDAVLLGLWMRDQVCVCRGDRQGSCWGPGPACIGGNIGSSSVWQPTDRTVGGAGRGEADPCTSSCGPAPAPWAPGAPQGRTEGPGVEGAGRPGGGEGLLAAASL